MEDSRKKEFCAQHKHNKTEAEIMGMKRNSLEKNAGGPWSLIKQMAVFLSVVSLCSYQASARGVGERTKIQTKKQQVKVTLGNFAGVQTNALEFDGIFDGTFLETSYKKLIRTGKDVMGDKTTLKEVIPPAQKEAFIENFLLPFYEKHYRDKWEKIGITGDEKKAMKDQIRKAVDAVNDFYTVYSGQSVGALIFKQKEIFEGKVVKFSQVDKGTRENGVNLYSPMYNTKISKRDVMKNGVYNPEMASSKWVKSLKQLLEKKALKQGKKGEVIEEITDASIHENQILGDMKIIDPLDNLPVKLMLVEAFNLAIIKRIAKSENYATRDVFTKRSVFVELNNVREAFYKGPIGNMDKKLETMAKLLTKNKPHAICVNEAPERLVKRLKEGYIPVRATTSSNASRLLIKRDKIQESKVVQLEKSHLKNYISQAEDPDLPNKIKKHTLEGSDEIAIAIVKFKGVKEPVALLCSHAGSKGEGSIAAISGFSNLLDEHTRSSNTFMEKMKDKAGDLYHRASSKIREKIDEKSCFAKKSSLDACSSKSESWYANKGVVAIAMQDSNTSVTNEKKLNLDYFLASIPNEFTPIWSNEKEDKYPCTTDKTRSHLQTQPGKAGMRARDQSDIISVMGLKVLEKEVTPAKETLTRKNPADHSITYATLEVREEVQPPTLPRR